MTPETVRVEALEGAGDLDAVLAIEVASFAHPTPRAFYERELLRPDVTVLRVLRVPGCAVAGFVSGWRAAGDLEISTLAVHPDWRGRGWGRRLLDDTLAWASREGLQRILLDVRRSNDAALALYRGAGFVQTGERRRYYSDPVEDALVLERRLPFSPKIGA